MAKTKKLTKTQESVMDDVRHYGVIMYHMDEGSFSFPDGKSVNRRTLVCLVRDGLIVPSGDSLFGAPSQTYRAAQ